MLLTICDCLMLKETKEMRRGKLCPTFSGQNTPSQFIFHVSLLSLIWLYKNGPGAHFCDMISNRGLCFSAQGAYTAFSFSGGIFYLYFINFDHTENFMSTRLNVISINFVKPQSGPDMSLTYISSMCGNLVEVGIAAMYSPCRKEKKWMEMYEISHTGWSAMPGETSWERGKYDLCNLVVLSSPHKDLEESFSSIGLQNKGLCLSLRLYGWLY